MTALAPPSCVCSSCRAHLESRAVFLQAHLPLPGHLADIHAVHPMVWEMSIFMYDTWFIMRLWTKHLSSKLSLLTPPSTPFTRHAYGWGSIPASLVIAYLLLGIEEIGVQIEEP